MVECEDVIPAGERPEDRHEEARGILVALERGATIGFLPAAVLAIKAFVEHADGPVVAQRVGRRHVRQSALEVVVEALPPASCSRRIPMMCSSVNRVFPIVRSPSQGEGIQFPRGLV